MENKTREILADLPCFLIFKSYALKAKICLKNKLFSPTAVFAYKFICSGYQLFSRTVVFFAYVSLFGISKELIGCAFPVAIETENYHMIAYVVNRKPSILLSDILVELVPSFLCPICKSVIQGLVKSFFLLQIGKLTPQFF